MSWSIEEALSQAVVRATRRMRDEGLASRVLAAEGRHITAAADARAQRLVHVLRRPWRDVFGVLRCSACAGHLEANRHGITVNPCSCPREVAVPAA